MYSTEIAFIFVLIAIAVALVVWYQFHPKVVEDIVSDDLRSICKQLTTCTSCRYRFVASDKDDKSMNCPICEYPASEDIFFKFEPEDYK